MAYSVPIVPNVLISWIQNYGNRFILVSTLSLASVGVFSLATSVASILMVLIMAFRMAWDPMATELMGREESRGIYARVFDYYMLFAALACAMLGSLGHLLVRLLAPPDYAAAGPLVTSLCMGYLWVGSLQIVALGINVVRKTYLGVVGYTVGLAVNMGLLWVCVRQEGLPAAGMTFLLGSIATGLVMYGISQRFFRVPYNRVLLLNMILFSVGLSLVFLRWDTWAPEPSSLVAQTSCRVAFALVTWCVVALVSLRREDRARLAQFVQGALVNHRYEF
jgi:O-antigen/teichoic acid export membrane protein